MAINRFIARVQLQEAQPTDFDKLDLEMERESFTRVRESRKPGERPQSTVTEYNVHGHLSILVINGAVSRAVTKIGKKYSYTVIREKKIFSPLYAGGITEAPAEQ